MTVQDNLITTEVLEDVQALLQSVQSIKDIVLAQEDVLQALITKLKPAIPKIELSQVEVEYAYQQSHEFDLHPKIIELLKGKVIKLEETNSDFFDYSFVNIIEHNGHNVRYQRMTGKSKEIKVAPVTPLVASFLQVNKPYLIHYASKRAWTGNPINYAATTDDIKRFTIMADQYRRLYSASRSNAIPT